MRILLTGGSGFIGRNILEQLGDVYEILAPTHAELELTDTDGVAAWLKQHPVDAVIHAAVRPGHRNAANPSRQLEIDLRMFANLTRCDDWGRMVYLSSGAIYGTAIDVVRASETDEGRVIPTDDHGFARYVLAALARQDDRVVELRPFGVFGPFEDYAIRFISNAICKTLFDLPVTLRQDRRFSYLYVDDLMPVLSHFLTGPPPSGGPYNVVPDHTDDLRGLAELVVAVSGKDIPIRVGAGGLGHEYTGDNTRLRAAMPDLEFTPSESAVERLYRWYADRKDSIAYERLLVDK